MTHARLTAGARLTGHLIPPTANRARAVLEARTGTSAQLRHTPRWDGGF